MACGLGFLSGAGRCSMVGGIPLGLLTNARVVVTGSSLGGLGETPEIVAGDFRNDGAADVVIPEVSPTQMQVTWPGISNQRQHERPGPWRSASTDAEKVKALRHECRSLCDEARCRRADGWRRKFTRPLSTVLGGQKRKSALLLAPIPLSFQGLATWCPKEDSNLHGVAPAST